MMRCNTALTLAHGKMFENVDLDMEVDNLVQLPLAPLSFRRKNISKTQPWNLQIHLRCRSQFIYIFKMTPFWSVLVFGRPPSNKANDLAIFRSLFKR